MAVGTRLATAANPVDGLYGPDRVFDKPRIWNHKFPLPFKLLRLERQEEDSLVEAAGVEPASASTPPSALHAYPVYCFNRLLPDWQGKQTAIPVSFNESASDPRHRDLA